MNRNGLILLQAVGALSILPYPFVLLANIMSIAAPGRNSINSLPWVLLSLYPLVWIGLYVFSWRAMARGEVSLAFGMSSVPALACVLAAGFYVYGWIGFALGLAGVGNGGLHTKTLTTSNPLVDSILLAGQDIQLPPGPAAAVDRALQEVDANPALLNVSVPGHGSPLNAAVGNLSIRVDGTINGGAGSQQERIRLVRALVGRGAHLAAVEANDLRKTWILRRALYDGPVDTVRENPLVWRIVTHESGDSKPFNPLTDSLPPRRDGPAPFSVKKEEIALLNRPTRLHGTPLYAALLDEAGDACRVIITAGGRLSAEEEGDPAVAAALRVVFERDPDLRETYAKAR